MAGLHDEAIDGDEDRRERRALPAFLVGRCPLCLIGETSEFRRHAERIAP